MTLVNGDRRLSIDCGAYRRIRGTDRATVGAAKMACGGPWPESTPPPHALVCTGEASANLTAVARFDSITVATNVEPKLQTSCWQSAPRRLPSKAFPGLSRRGTKGKKWHKPGLPDVSFSQRGRLNLLSTYQRQKTPTSLHHAHIRNCYYHEAKSCQLKMRHYAFN